MILIYIALILLGYFLGLISSLLQVINMENKENKKIQEILDKN